MVNIVSSALVSNVAFDDGFVALAADGGDVVAVGLELASPEFLLDGGDGFEDVACGDALDKVDNLTTRVFREEATE